MLVFGHKTYRYPSKYKSLFERRKSDFLLFMVKLFAPRFRIRIPNADLGEPSKSYKVQICEKYYL
jgi:hypothetical protein